MKENYSSILIPSCGIKIILERDQIDRALNKDWTHYLLPFEFTVRNNLQETVCLIGRVVYTQTEYEYMSRGTWSQGGHWQVIIANQITNHCLWLSSLVKVSLYIYI